MRQNEIILGYATVADRFNYDPITGELRWKRKTAKRTKVGEIAGWIEKQGYARVNVDNKHILVHRIAWCIYYGEWPSFQIDHINGIRSDNRICNLRKCTPSLNAANSTGKPSRSGVKNVHWHEPTRKWIVVVKRDGKCHHFGYFTNVGAANVVAESARHLIFGEFACGNRTGE